MRRGKKTFKTKSEVDQYIVEATKGCTESEISGRSLYFATAYMSIKEYSSAEHYIRRYVCDYRTSKGYFLLGETCEPQQKYDQAMDAYRVCINIDKDQPLVIERACDVIANNFELLKKRAPFWSTMAEKQQLKRPGVHKMRLLMMETDNKYEPSKFEELLRDDITARPHQLEPHINLCNYFIKLGKYNEAFQHMYQLEFKQSKAMIKDLDWYNAVADMLDGYKMMVTDAKTDWKFWHLYLEVLERQVFHGLAIYSPVDGGSDADIIRKKCVDYLLQFDQDVCTALRCIGDVGGTDGDFVRTLLSHMLANLYLHTASFILTRELRSNDALKWQHGVRMALPLLFMVLQMGVVDVKEHWVTLSTIEQQRDVKRWQSESAFRCLQAAGTIVAYIAGDLKVSDPFRLNESQKEKFMLEMNVLCTANWRTVLFEFIFPKQPHFAAGGNSSLLTNVTIDKPTFYIPVASELEQYEKLCSELEPSNLQFFVYLAIRNNADIGTKSFNVHKLPLYCTDNMEDIRLCTITAFDIDAFIYAAAHQARARLLNESNSYSNYGTLPLHTMPYSVTYSGFCTTDQAVWWHLMYNNVNNYTALEKINETNSFLSRVLEAVRFLGRPKMNLLATLQLMKIFIELPKLYMDDRKTDQLKKRAWNAAEQALSMYTEKRVLSFDAYMFTCDMTASSPKLIVDHLMDMGIEFMAREMFERKEYKKCIDKFSKVDLPRTSLCLAVAWRHIENVAPPQGKAHEIFTNSLTALRRTHELMDNNASTGHIDPMALFMDNEMKDLERSSVVDPGHTNGHKDDSFKQMLPQECPCTKDVDELKDMIVGVQGRFNEINHTILGMSSSMQHQLNEMKSLLYQMVAARNQSQMVPPQMMNMAGNNYHVQTPSGMTTDAMGNVLPYQYQMAAAVNQSPMVPSPIMNIPHRLMGFPVTQNQLPTPTSLMYPTELLIKNSGNAGADHHQRNQALIHLLATSSPMPTTTTATPPILAASIPPKHTKPQIAASSSNIAPLLSNGASTSSTSPFSVKPSPLSDNASATSSTSPFSVKASSLSGNSSFTSSASPFSVKASPLSASSFTSSASPFSAKASPFSNLTGVATSTSLFGNIVASAVPTPATIPAAPATAAAEPDEPDDYVPTAVFAPVIPLPPKITVVTGEEDEEVLFAHRAKLLRYDNGVKEWKERGIGEMKVLRNKKDPSMVRLLMRREAIFKLCCNQRLKLDTQFKPYNKMDTALVWAGQDFSENEMTNELFVIRFKTKETCKDFKEAIDKALVQLASESEVVIDVAGEIEVPDDSTETIAEDEYLSVDSSFVTASETSVTTPLSEMFKNTGGWSCNDCYLKNVETVTACAACNADRYPGGSGDAAAAPKSKELLPKHKLFGTLAPPSGKAFTFGMTPPPVTSSAPKDPVNPSPTTTAAVETPLTKTLPPLAPMQGGFSFGVGGTTPISFKTPSKALNEKTEFSFRLPMKAAELPEVFKAAPNNDEDLMPEEENTTHFNPVVTLPEVEVVTGEEDEDVLYTQRSKLYRYTDGEWKERGIGDVKILKHKTTNKLRMIMRRMQILKLCLNHALTDENKFNMKDARSLNYVACDFSDGDMQVQHLCLRFKNAQIANDFKLAIEKALRGEEILPLVEEIKGDEPALPLTSAAATEEELITTSLPLIEPIIPLPSVAATNETKSRPNKPIIQSSSFVTPPTTAPTEKKEALQEGSPFFSNTTFNISKSSASNIFGGSSNIFGGGSADAIALPATDFKFVSAAHALPSFGGPSTSTNEPAVKTNAPLFGSVPPVFGGAIGSNIASVSSNDSSTSTNKTLIKTNAPLFGSVPNVFGGAIGSNSAASFGNKTYTMSDSPAEPDTVPFVSKTYAMFDSPAERIAANLSMNATTTIFGATPSETATHLGGKAPTPSSQAHDILSTEASVFKADDNLSFAILSESSTSNIPTFSGANTPAGGFFGLTQSDSFKSFMPKPEGQSEDAVGGDEEYDPHYDPVIALPNEIKVVTGEEDEVKLFSTRATLYRFDSTSKEWKERGVGEIKVLHHPTNLSYRLLMRREQIHKCVLNAALSANFVITKLAHKAYMFAVMNYAEGDPESAEKLSVRFKTVELGEEFYTLILDCVQKIKTTPPDLKPNED